MTLAELANETLVEKNRRTRQEKCLHAAKYSSTVMCSAGSFTNSFCWDCGKLWRLEMSPAHRETGA